MFLKIAVVWGLLYLLGNRLAFHIIQNALGRNNKQFDFAKQIQL